ncbi:pentatricopeptide repeat-containing protein At5g27110 [Selaginella moellendorffii]|uniref:pentatricopeptide repeat-containing protein At5g27110 n=1 Tax=Selaginella moellendorffii TaxID=88036 RepID=UPI000D1C5B10|nr:pentatricopeptide repeat-containing protein At5g27110 [Selaginella moellendorffii]|eukprot:XP_024524815.1 pentatricopeptide repeat-containing protein At5g27110 [Selaginella moellendorffii]
MIALSNDHAAAIRWCSLSRNIAEGRRIDGAIVKSGQNGDCFLCNLLIQMYGRCGSVDEARSVFDRMPRRNDFSWSILLTAYAQNGRGAEALELLDRMEERRILPHRTTLVSAISACASSGNLARGRQLHAAAIARRLDRETLLANSLIAMYGKCHSLAEAERLFHSLERKDPVTWNTMIGAFTHNGQPRLAVDLYARMGSGDRNSVTFLGVLEACSALGDLDLGRTVDSSIAGSEWRDDVVVGTAVVGMYGRCRSIEEARQRFDSMPVKNVLGSLSLGRSIHLRITRGGDGGGTRLENALISMYGKLENLEESLRVFEVMANKDVVSWTAMITAYAQNGHERLALELYRRMELEKRVRPDRVTYAAVLGACSGLGDLSTGKEIYARVCSSDFDVDAALKTSLVGLYGKCHCLEDAKEVFDSISSRDRLAYNAMLAAYAQNGHPDDALNLYRQMVEELKDDVDTITFVTILAVCSASNLLEQGRRIQDDIERLGYQQDEVVGSALISLYGTCKCLEEARAVFQSFSTRSSSNAVVWNAMITALFNNSHEAEAVGLFRKMDLEGVEPTDTSFAVALMACTALKDLVTGKSLHGRIQVAGIKLDEVLATTLVGFYGEVGSLEEAERIFEQMPVKDVFSYSAMIGAYSQNGCEGRAMTIYAEMDQQGIKPDEVAFISVLSACSSNLATEVHTEIVHAGFEADGALGTALVCMYAKSGNLEESRRIFGAMKSRDSVSWTAMISAFARHGCEAKLLFQGMALDGIDAKGSTLTSMLVSYSQSGVDAARGFFVAMQGDFGTCPAAEHYSCLVDLLARSGRVGEAKELVDSMPLEPDFVPWMTLLGACKTHGDLEQAKSAARGVLEVDSHSPGAYLVLSTLCSGWGTKLETPKLPFYYSGG